MTSKFLLKEINNESRVFIGIKLRLLRMCKCRYTIDQTQTICPVCNEHFKTAYPPKFSLHDKYAAYRRQMKEWARDRGV